MWLKMYQCDSKCINVTQNVSMWLKTCQSDSKCIIVTQNVSVWLKMYQCDSKCINVTQYYWHKSMSFNIDPDDLNKFNDLKQKWVKMIQINSKWWGFIHMTPIYSNFANRLKIISDYLKLTVRLLKTPNISRCLKFSQIK